MVTDTDICVVVYINVFIVYKCIKHSQTSDGVFYVGECITPCPLAFSFLLDCWHVG